MEQAEEWLTGRQYLDMSLLERGNHKQEADLKLDPRRYGRGGGC